MPRTNFAAMGCSIAKTFDIVGEPWTPLILRDVWLGLRRFDQIQADLGISRNVLAKRLDVLVERGIVERQRYQDGPPRYDYVLTEQGRELCPPLLALMAWGDRFAAAADGPPVHVHH